MLQRYALFFDIDGTLVSFDTSMILQAGIGIAMGNAIDSLKQQADYVTTSVDDNGILNALRHFHII
jgi:hydroxymethylpyrimidine pyrophosphatase-like HAD family hydrolase